MTQFCNLPNLQQQNLTSAYCQENDHPMKTNHETCLEIFGECLNVREVLMKELLPIEWQPVIIFLSMMKAKKCLPIARNTALKLTGKKDIKGLSYLLAHLAHPLSGVHQQWLLAKVDFISPSETCCRCQGESLAHNATRVTYKRFSSKLLVDKYSKSSLGTFGTSAVLWPWIWDISLRGRKGLSIFKQCFRNLGGGPCGRSIWYSGSGILWKCSLSIFKESLFLELNYDHKFPTKSFTSCYPVTIQALQVPTDPQDPNQMNQHMRSMAWKILCMIFQTFPKQSKHHWI